MNSGYYDNIQAVSEKIIDNIAKRVEEAEVKKCNLICIYY